MKASERLRELDAGAATEAPWERFQASNLRGDGPVIKNAQDFDWVATVQVSNVPNWRENAQLIVTLRNALPLIADTLEKAEEMSDWLELQSSNRYGRDLIPIHEFDAVLTALKEALSGD